MRRGLAGIIATAAICVHCAASAPGARPVPFRPPSTNQGTATIVVIEKGGALNMTYIVAMDAQYRFVGGLSHNRWFEAHVQPGHHDFYAIPMFLGLPKDGRCEGFSADLSAGQTYYVLFRGVFAAADCDQSNAQCNLHQLNSTVLNDDDYDPSLAVGMKPGEFRWDISVLNKREKVRFNPDRYLQRFERVDPVENEGQALLDHRLGKFRCQAYVTPLNIGPQDYMQ